MLKGKRTYILALAVAFAPEVASAAAGVDWTTLGLSPHAAGVIGTLIAFFRTITTGPAFVLVKSLAPMPASDAAKDDTQ